MSTKVRQVRVPADRAGQRLDNFLMGELKGVPKTLIYRIIRKGEARINGGRCKPMQKLEAGDQVRIPPVRTGAEGPAVRFSDEQLNQIRSAVIHEDNRYLVIDKPSGLAVHAGSGLGWGVIDLLRAARRDDFIELVHRIDRETSGCLLLAKSRQALLDAQDLMRRNEVEKRYLCLMHGDLHQEPFTVEAKLRKAGEGGVIVADDGKPARTDFRPTERYRGWTLVEANLATGRTHQIRVHAAHIEHGLAGDDRYGPEQCPRGLKRLFLHCSMMSFDLADGYSLTVSAPLPDDLRGVLDRLRVA